MEKAQKSDKHSQNTRERPVGLEGVGYLQVQTSWKSKIVADYSSGKKKFTHKVIKKLF